MNLLHQRYALSTGVTLHVARRPGSGTPVICLHGIWDEWRYFESLLDGEPEVFPGQPLLMVDHRGHGESDKPETGYDWSDYAADLVALVEAQGFERVILVGHSLGAVTCLLAAAEMPERVAAMVLEDPPLPMRLETADAFQTLLEMKRQPMAAIIEEFQIWRPFLSPEEATESARRLKQTADGPLLAVAEREAFALEIPKPGVVIDAPTLVIQAGLEDQRAFHDGGRELLEPVFPNLTVETIPRTSHNVLRDQPEQYRALLAEWYDAHVAANLGD